MPQRAACVRRLDVRDLFRRADGHNLTTRLAPVRPEVDDVVGRLDHVEVVLDDQQRVPGLDQFSERGKQFRDVVEVQAGGRLIEDVEDALPAKRSQVRGDLDPLRLPSRQRGRRLTEAQISQPDFIEHLQPAQHFG